MGIITVNYIMLALSWAVAIAALSPVHRKYIWWCAHHNHIEWALMGAATAIMLALCQLGWYFSPVLGIGLVVQGFAFSEAFMALSKSNDAIMKELMAKKEEEDGLDK